MRNVRRPSILVASSVRMFSCPHHLWIQQFKHHFLKILGSTVFNQNLSGSHDEWYFRVRFIFVQRERVLMEWSHVPGRWVSQVLCPGRGEGEYTPLWTDTYLPCGRQRFRFHFHSVWASPKDAFRLSKSERESKNFFWSLSPVNMNSTLNFLPSHLEVMSLSRSPSSRVNEP